MIQSAAEVLRQEGHERGHKKGREEVAARSLRKGMDPETVADITQLSKDKILKLQREIDENSEHQDS